MNISKPKGMQDFFGEKQVSFDAITSLLETLSQNFGYEKITFPTIEKEILFNRSVGDGTDVVNKEMYTFQDRKGRMLSLRPEGSASCTRLVIENDLIGREKKEIKLFYTANMFRYERPQRGRSREFFQFGIEHIGSKNKLFSDFEILMIGDLLLKKLEIEKYKLEINYLGSDETRNKFKTKLVKFFNDNKDKLSMDSLNRLEINPLRILDSKDKKDKEIIKNAPKLSDSLNEDEVLYFESLKKLLTKHKINFSLNTNLVRGLDYYNELVFEFISLDDNKIGSQSALIAGGRYDKLYEKLGSKESVPAIGFSIGIDRLILVANKFIEKVKNKEVDYYITPINSDFIEDSYKILKILSVDLNKNCKLDIRNIKLSKKIEIAYNYNVKKFLVIDDEIQNDFVIIKNLAKKTQRKISIKNLEEE